MAGRPSRTVRSGGRTMTPQVVDERETLATLFLAHYLDPASAERSPDNFSSCVCGEWSEGEMEPGWDDHLADVAVDAGFHMTPTPDVGVLAEVKKVREQLEFASQVNSMGPIVRFGIVDVSRWIERLRSVEAILDGGAGR